MTTCDACGCCLSFCQEVGSYGDVVALRFKVSPPFVAEQVFAPYENKEYNICFPCCLKAFGVPLPKEKP